MKGDYLLKLFKNVSRLPSKINFIDDKKSQVDLVALALHQLGIDHQCYWYPFTEAKTVLFDPLSANIQLYYFWASEGRCILSDAEAALIAEQDPSKEEALSFKRKIF